MKRCLLVAVLGALVLFGWVADVGVLKSVRPEWVSMKPLTGMLFCLVAMGMIAVRLGRPWRIFSVVLAWEVLRSSGLAGVWWWLEASGGLPWTNLLPHPKETGVMTVAPGMPSLGTLLAFTSLASGIFAHLMNRDVARMRLGVFAGCLGGVGLLGYAVGSPTLYYSIAGVSTGMAIHTAAAFVILATVMGRRW